MTVDDPSVVHAAPVLITSPHDVRVAPGQRAPEEFELTGLAEGQTVVRFAQARPFEADRPPRAQEHCTVRVMAAPEP